MPHFHVDQNAVKTLAKDLRAALGFEVRHKAMIRHICAALGWRDDALMHHLKQFAEAGRDPFPAIAVPASFSRDLAQILSKSYGRDISRAVIDRHFHGRDMVAAGFLRPSEAIFGAVARTMVRNGWSVFPQELSGRRPGSIDGRIIKWNDEGHDLVNTPPGSDILDLWIERCPALNVAAVMGPASGNAFIIDVDVADPGLSAAIQKLAVKHLGQTPLRRMGRWPMMALVYRQNADDRISSNRHGIGMVDQTSNPGGAEQCIEVLAEGRAITMHGKVSATGSWFRWMQNSPVDVGPEACPIVTSAQLADFFAAVDELPAPATGGHVSEIPNILNIEDPVEIYVQDIPGFKVTDFDHSTREERIGAFRKALAAAGCETSELMIVESLAAAAARLTRIGSHEQPL
jgi:hypothetical protein